MGTTLYAVYDTVRYYVWHEKFWFPPNVTWDDLKNTDNGIYHPQLSDMLVPLVLAVVLLIVRRIFERCIADPVGLYIGIPPPKTFHQNKNHPALTRLYKTCRNPVDSQISEVVKQTDLTTRQVHRWIRIENKRSSTSKLRKFSESFWRLVFYLSTFIVGTCILWDKPWLFDSYYGLVGYPHHHVSNGVYWYMMVEMAYYWAALFTQFTDVKRKDATVMGIHHVTTLLLMFFSWVDGLVRSFMFVVYIHDAADIFMEATKLTKYSRNETMCSIFFGLFGLVWLVTRLIIFPYRVVLYSIFRAQPIIGYYPFFYILNVLLIILQILHVIWFLLIIKVAVLAIKGGNVQGDVRSETDEKSYSENEQDTNSMQNGTKHK